MGSFFLRWGEKVDELVEEIWEWLVWECVFDVGLEVVWLSTWARDHDVIMASVCIVASVSSALSSLDYTEK